MGRSFGFRAAELSAVGYDYFFGGLIAGFSGEILDFADDRFAIQDFAEDYVLAIEVGG